MQILVTLGGLAVAILLWGALTYNRLVSLRAKAENSWGDIETQLKRRWDLIPTIVASVKGYASHEAAVYEKIAAARARSATVSSPRELAHAEQGLKGAMKSLFAVVEAYPNLQASQNFMQLQQELEQIEDAVQRSRHYYNAVVRDYNTSLEVFPRNYVASLFGFHKRAFFSLTDEAERTTPSVRFR